MPTKKLVKWKGMRLRLARRQPNVRVRNIVQENAAERREAKMDVNEDKHKYTSKMSEKKQQDEAQDV